MNRFHIKQGVCNGHKIEASNRYKENIALRKSTPNVLIIFI